MSTATAPPVPPAVPPAGPPAGPAADTAPSTTPSPLRAWLRRWGGALVLAALTVVAALLIATAPDGRPLDPRSADPGGTKALVEVLRELGATVRISDAVGQPAPRDNGATDVAVVLADRFMPQGRDELAAWTAAGGTLVVADPFSALTPPLVVAQVPFGVDQLAPGCTSPLLTMIDEVVAPSAQFYELPAGADGCFGRQDGFFMITSPQGQGRLVALGGALQWTNARLDQADNALLAVALLAPDPSRATVTIIDRLSSGERDATLSDLVAPSVKVALLQLAVAFVVLALWQGRRLGRPVHEPQPVTIPGSELVVAVGNLYQSTRARERAVAALRGALQRDLSTRFGLPASVPPADIAAAVSARTGLSSTRAQDLLTGPVPDSEAALVALAQQLDSFRVAALTERRLAAEPSAAAQADAKQEEGVNGVD